MQANPCRKWPTKPEILSPRTAPRRCRRRSTTNTSTSSRTCSTTGSAFPAPPSASASTASSASSPAIGDVIGGIASCIIIFAAWMRGVSYVTLARMIANWGIEVLLGTVPVLGNLFDIAWKRQPPQLRPPRRRRGRAAQANQAELAVLRRPLPHPRGAADPADAVLCMAHPAPLPRPVWPRSEPGTVNSIRIRTRLSPAYAINCYQSGRSAVW
jgi:hypothetical protein